jgi:hypothetical protein
VTRMAPCLFGRGQIFGVPSGTFWRRPAFLYSEDDWPRVEFRGLFLSLGLLKASLWWSSAVFESAGRSW